MQNFVALRITVAMATLQNFNFFRVFERHNLREATRASRLFIAAPRKWYRWIEQEISFHDDFQHFSINFCRFIGPLPKAARSKRLRPKRPLFSLRDFVCPPPGGQTAGRIAMKLGTLKHLWAGVCTIPRNPGIGFPFSRKREISLFDATVPALGAIFSRMKT